MCNVHCLPVAEWRLTGLGALKMKDVLSGFLDFNLTPLPPWMVHQSFQQDLKRNFKEIINE